MRDQKAQMSVDFLIGMLIFAGVLLFTFQFLTGSILPYTQNTDGTTATVERVGDSLYYDRLADGEKGLVNLSYLYDKTDNELKTESELLTDLGVDKDRHGINVTVWNETGISGSEIVRINESGLVDTGGMGDGEPARIGGPPPDAGAGINVATRIGYVSEPAGDIKPMTVVIEVRMW